MHRNRRKPERATQRQPHRRGTAPVEFVMALPMLLSMFILIMTVGAVNIARLDSTVKSRAESWADRPNKKSNRPLAYLSSTSKDDVFEKTSTVVPRYPSPKMTFGSATSKHAVLGGAWDHRELLKGDGPHWGDMAKASIGGATNQIGSLLDQFSNGFDLSQLPSLGEVAGGLAGSLLDQQDSVNEQFEEEAQKQKEANKKNIEKLEKRNQELAAEKAQLQKELNEQLYPQKKELEQRMEERKEQFAKEKDEDKKKELLKQQDADQKQLDSVNGQIAQKEARIKVINNEMEANRGLIDRLKSL